jgi:signal transduction histidine kinase
MGGRRGDLAVAAAGAVFGAGAAALSSHGVLDTVSGILLGAVLGAARSRPMTTFAAATGMIVAATALGAVPTGGGLALDVLVAAHMLCAGRWAETVIGVAGVIALACASEVSAAAETYESSGPPGFSIVLAGAWAAGRAVRARAEVADRLAERARDLEVEREAHAQLSVRYERARIAAELHDIVAHAISVMVVQASAGQRLAGVDAALAAEAFDAIAGSAREAQGDIARLVALLADADAVGHAPDLGLVEELVSRAAGSGLDVTLRLAGDREGLPAEVVQTVYRVVQEGLTNALRYSAGSDVSVRIDGTRDALVVEVLNGPATARGPLEGAGTGNGLRGLRERIDACAGTLDAGPTGDGGWCLRARLPRRVPARAG